MSLTVIYSPSSSDRNNPSSFSNRGILLSEKPLGHRFCTYIILFCFYFQTLWPSVAFATEVEVMRPVSPLSPTRFFYSPSQPEPRTMVLDLGVLIDDKDETFDTGVKKQTLTLPFTEFADEIQDLITQSVAIQSLYPGLKSSEQGYSWIHYGYSFFLENNGHLQVKPKAGEEHSSLLRLYNTHGPITVEERVPSYLRVKGQQVLFKHCRGTLKELSVWATGVGKTTESEGTVVIDYASLLAVKKATIHQGTLHNAGTLVVAAKGTLEAKERTLLNYGTLEMGDRTHLKAKEVTNRRVQKDPSSALVVGYIKGKGTTTVDIGTFRNSGDVQIPTLQGCIHHLANTGHFEALKDFNNLIILDLLNDVGGRILGQGALTLKGVNKGLLQGKSITFTLDGDFTNTELGTIRAEDGLNTQGSGSFLQRGALETKRLSIDNARFENFAQMLQDQMSIIIGSNVAYWRNHEGGKLNTKQLVVNRSSLASSQLLNEGGIETGVFKNNGSSFINSGPMLLERWDQSGASFKNQFGGEIRVLELFKGAIDTLDNAGDIHFDAEVLGGIAHILNAGGLFFNGKTTLQGFDIRNKKLMRSKAAFEWTGQTVLNEGDMYLGTLTVRDHFTNPGAAEIKTLALEKAKGLHNKGTLCITGQMKGDVDIIDSSGLLTLKEQSRVTGQTFNATGVIKAENGLLYNGKTFTTGDKTVLDLRGQSELTLTTSPTFLGVVDSQGELTLNAPEITNKAKFKHTNGKVTTAARLTNEGDMDISHLTYLNSWLKNTNTMHLRHLEMPSALKMLINEQGTPGAEFAVYKGNVSFETIRNQAKIVLKDGTYSFYEGLEENTGEILVDGEMVLLDRDYVLKGIVAAKKLKADLKTKTLTVDGKTTFESGELATAKIHITPTSQLTLADGTYTTHVLSNSGLLITQPKMKLNAGEAWGDGAVESKHGLRVLALDAGQEAQSVEDDTPTVVLGYLKNEKAFGQLLNLSNVSVTGDVTLEFPKRHNIGYWVDFYSSGWHQDGALILYAYQLVQTRGINRGGALKLFLHHYQNTKHQLIVNALDLVADQIDIGTSNDEMAIIKTLEDPTIKGPQDNHLTITKRSPGDLNLKFAKVFGNGETDLKALQGDVFIGDYRVPSHPDFMDLGGRLFNINHNGDFNYHRIFQFLPINGSLYKADCNAGLEARDATIYFNAFEGFKRTGNGAYIQSNDKITISAPKGDVTLSYAALESIKELIIKARDKVRNVAGSMKAPKMTFTGKSFEQVIDGLGSILCSYEAAFFPMSQRPKLETDTLTLLFQNYLTYGSESIITQSFTYSGKDGRPVTVRPNAKIMADTFRELACDSYFYDDTIYFPFERAGFCEALRRLIDQPWSDEFKSMYQPMGANNWTNFSIPSTRHTGNESTVFARIQEHKGYAFASKHSYTGSIVTVQGGTGGTLRETPKAGTYTTFYMILEDAKRKSYWKQLENGSTRSDTLKDSELFTKGQEPTWTRSALGLNPTFVIQAEANLVKSAILRLMGIHTGRINHADRYGDDMINYMGGRSQYHALQGALTAQDKLSQVKEMIFFYREVVINGKPLAVVELSIPESMVDSDSGLGGTQVGVDSDIVAEEIRMVRARVKMDHNVKLTATEADIALLGSQVKAGHNVDMDAKRNLWLESLADRHDNGFKSYTDHKTTTAIEAGNDINAHAGLDSYRKGIVMKAGGNITLTAARRIIDETLALAQQRFESHGKDWTLERIIRHSVSEYEAGGGFTQIAGSGQDLYAVQIKALQKKILLVSGAEGTRVHEVHDEHYRESHQEGDEKGFLGSGRDIHHSVYQEVQSVGAKFISPKGADVISFGDIDLTNINLQVPHTLLKTMGGVVRILLGTNHSASQSMSYESDMLSQYQESHKEEHHTYAASQVSGTVEVHARNLIIEQVRGQALDWLERIQLQGTKSIQTVWREEVHQVEHHESSNISPALGMVIGLAVSIALAGSDMGMGSTLISGLGVNATAAAFITGATTAAFASVCSQAAISMLNHQGDIGKVLKDLTSDAGFKAVVMAAVSGGLTKGMGQALGVDAAGKTFVDHLGREALKAGVGASLAMATGADVGDALGHAARGMMASSVGASLANEIGLNVSNFVVKELFHGASGATMGWMLSGTTKGAIGAGIAAIASTSFASITQGDLNAVGARAVVKARAEDSPLDRKSLSPYVQAELQSTVDLSRFAGAVATFLSGHDVGIGIEVATTAVVNNCAATMERQVFETSALKEALQQAADAVPEFMVTVADLIEENPKEVGLCAELLVLTMLAIGEERGATGPKLKTPGHKKVDGLVKKGVVSAVKATPKALREGAEKLRSGKAAEMAMRKAPKTGTTEAIKVDPNPLLAEEGAVSTYRELKKLSRPGDHLTPNHMPQSAYMQSHGVSHQDGVAMMMEQPHPGSGGRHRMTRTYGKQPDLNVTPRQELARDIADARKIYQTQEVYTTDIRKGLQEVILKNKEMRPDLFQKVTK